MKTKNISSALISLIILAASPLPTYAASPNPAVSGEKLSTVISKGDADITLRINSLNKEQTRLQSLKHLPNSEKTNFVNQIQAEITALNSQKAKLDADTDVKVARDDRAAIFNQFRIYMLFIPKSNILAAADSMNEVADLMNTIAGKLQTRISEAQSQGKDVTALNTALTDLQSKIADAKSQYTNAENTVNPLVPDKGDQSIITSNQAALKSARGMIKTGATDLKTGRTDIQTIWNGLKAIHLTASPSPAP